MEHTKTTFGQLLSTTSPAWETKLHCLIVHIISQAMVEHVDMMHQFSAEVNFELEVSM